METSSDLNDFVTDKNYCLVDFLDFEKENLDQYCFELEDSGIQGEGLNGQEENKENSTNKIYVQIKQKKYTKNGDMKTMLSIVDISKSILYEHVHAQNQFLAITNATVSHELRNPLQSIDAQNLKIQLCLKELRSLIKENKDSLHGDLSRKIKEIATMMEQSNKI